jgi:hypothetical protein
MRRRNAKKEKGDHPKKQIKKRLRRTIFYEYLHPIMYDVV